MKTRLLKCFAGFLFVALMFAACKDPNTIDGVKLADYTFTISSIPYASKGLTVVARVNLHNKNYDYELGTIGNSPADTVIEKTVKMPVLYSKITLFFLDQDKKEIFYYPVEEKYNKTGSRNYTIDGYYYYYYEYGYPSYDKPYYALSEKHLNTVEFGKTYEFDSEEAPFMLFKVSGVLNKKIGIKLNQSYPRKVEVYVANSKEKFMNYETEYLNVEYGCEYDCPANEAYFMVRTGALNDKETATITFTNISFAMENGLKIQNYDKTILASDGKIYLTGDTYADHSYETARNYLYCINPSTGTRSLAADLSSRIECVEELDKGILYIAAQNKTIKKFNLSTGQLTAFVSDLPIFAEAMVNYKDNKFIMTGREDTSDYYGKVVLIDKSNGEKTVLETRSYSSIGNSTQLFYSQENDLFIGINNHGTPWRLDCLKILDVTNGTIISNQSWDDMQLPIIIYKTSPLQILDANGEIFGIDINNLGDKHNWCKSNGMLCKSYDDCYIKDNYIYYMKNDNGVLVEKCALSKPQTIINQQKFDNKTGKKLFYNDNKLYLLSNSLTSDYVSYSNLVYLDQISF